MWCPPTPPHSENDVYVDQSICFLYDSAVMTEAQLPPVHVKKEKKRKLDTQSSTVTKKKARLMHEEQPRQQQPVSNRPPRRAPPVIVLIIFFQKRSIMYGIVMHSNWNKNNDFFAKFVSPLLYCSIHCLHPQMTGISGLYRTKQQSLASNVTCGR